MFCRNHLVSTQGMSCFMRITLYLPGEWIVLWKFPLYLPGECHVYRNHPVSTCREWMRISYFVGNTLYPPSGKEWKCHVLWESPCIYLQGMNENVMFCWKYPVSPYKEKMKMSCFVGITLYPPAGKEWKCHVLWESPCIHLQGINENKNGPGLTILQ